MRLSILTGFAASAAIVGASLAPVSAHVARPAMPNPHGPAFQGITPPRMTLNQLAHYRATVLPKAVQQRALLYTTLHHPVLSFTRDTNPTTFIMDDAGYIFGLSGSTVVSRITDCSGAEGGILDHSGRLVVACTNTRTVQVYNPPFTACGVPPEPACPPANLVLLDNIKGNPVTQSYYFPAAAFEDNKGTIYATNLFGETNCTPFCSFANGNIVWWNKKDQVTNHFATKGYTDPNLVEDYFGDVDGEGDVYVDGFGPEVDEIENIKSAHPTATNLGISLGFPGGVYVTSPRTSSELLSVIDQTGTAGPGSDNLRVYTIPFTGTPKYTDTPPQNINDSCDPVAGGYDPAEAHILIGDAGCHVGLIGTIATNSWTTVFNTNFIIPIDGAYNPSDK